MKLTPKEEFILTKILDQSPQKPLLTITIMSETPKDLDFINLNDIASAPPTIPAQEYHMKIVEGQIRENKNKDGFYFSYRAVVQSGEYAGESVFGMWSFKDAALWKLKKDFKAMGYNPPDGKPKKDDLIGFEGIAKVYKRPRRDDTRDIPDAEKEQENGIDRWISPIV